MDPYYIIVGQTVDLELTYWQEGFGWTASKKHATHYTANVLTTPLPEGSIGTVLVDKTCSLLGSVGEGRGGSQIFEKIV